MSKTSYQNKNQKYLEHIDELLKILPRYMKNFVYEIEQRMLPASQDAYLSDLKIFFDYLIENNPSIHNYNDITMEYLNELTLMDFNEFFHDMRRTSSEKDISRKVSSIHKFFDYLLTHHYISNRDALSVKNPKIPEATSITYMRPDEVRMFLHNVETGEFLPGRQKKFHEHERVRDLAMLSLMLGTGIRVSECTGLDLDDVNLEEQSIHIIRKGNKEDYVIFADYIREYLEAYMVERKKKIVADDDKNALFLNRNNTRMSPRSVQNLVKKYADPSIIGTKHITPHKLRSTYGTALLEATGNIAVVSEVLGHKSVNTSSKYYAAVQERRKREAGSINVYENDKTKSNEP